MGKESTSEGYKTYKRTNLSEMIFYTEGMDMQNISISNEDKENGSPKLGDMIARNPKNHNDKWLVSKNYFKDNFEELEETDSNGKIVISFNEQGFDANIKLKGVSNENLSYALIDVFMNTNIGQGRDIKFCVATLLESIQNKLIDSIDFEEK